MILQEIHTGISICSKPAASRLNCLIKPRNTAYCIEKVVFFLPVNTKAEVRFHLASADWIPEAVREKMASMVTTLSPPTLHSSSKNLTILTVSVITPCFYLLSTEIR